MIDVLVPDGHKVDTCIHDSIITGLVGVQLGSEVTNYSAENVVDCRGVQVPINRNHL